jgi:peptidoglycan/LPS O-acetylase OafA/YrhL
VLGVLLYHADVTAVPGGFLGVEVFFVLSGFLITSLLLSEWRARGRIDLRHFWLARARRLLPALFAVLATVSVVAVLFFRDEVAELRRALAAALTYTSNWYLIFSGQSYFQSAGRPSALEHLWSLAVEEQFYLVWPVVLLFVISRWGVGRLVAVTAVGALASAVLMGAMFVPGGDPSRVYMGTDTRAAGLLVGALLAYAWAPGALRRTGRPGVAVIMNGVGLLALGGVVWFMVSASEYGDFLYRGGFLALSLVVAVLIGATVHPDARLLGRTLLGSAVMVWVGRRSYGIYLWHWPVFVVTRPELDLTLSGPPLLALRLGLTLVLAELSYRFLELPIRSGAVRRWWAATDRRGPRVRLAQATGASVLALTGLVALTGALMTTQSRIPQGVATTTASLSAANAAAGTAPAATARSLVPPGMREVVPGEAEGVPVALRGWRPGEGRSARQAERSASAWPPLPSSLGRITAIGDSVMVGAAPVLEELFGSRGRVDALISRQWDDGVDVLTELAAQERLGDTVVVHLGSNGPITADQFDRMMSATAGARNVVLVTTKVPRRWESITNQALADGVARYPKARLADWHAAVSGSPELLTGDGIHLRGNAAIRLYAETVRGALLQF